MLTHDVTIWGIRRRKNRRKPYELRWKTGPQPQSKSFLTRALADQYRADLLTAARKGEPFDTVDGFPPSLKQTDEEPDAPPLSWFDFVCEYVAYRWRGAAANTRDSIIDGLATATLTLARDEAAHLDAVAIRAAVRIAAIAEAQRFKVEEMADKKAGFTGSANGDLALAIKLLKRHTGPIVDLEKPLAAQHLWDALGVKLDGTPATRDTAQDRRRAVNTALEYAVAREYLSANPFKQVKRKRTAHDGAVDRRVVANPTQVRELLIAVSYIGSWKRARGRRLVAFFATLYYAGLRPAEAIALRKSDCELPQHGWGLLTLAETRPTSGRKYTDTGDVHDRRGLKQREREDVRPVSIPPDLVQILRAHIKAFGTADDGRLFRNERGGVLGSTTYTRAWQEARRLALKPQQVASPLAGTPYDLRHAALSTWLNGGVDATDVADRAGNSVEVLLKRYAKCLDGHQERNNRLIERALQVVTD